MKKRSLAVVVCVLAVMNVASADIVRGINIDFVTIGHAGNPGDTRTGTDEIGFPLANPYGCGAVGYEYQIGKYEITNAQWNTFTAAAGAPTGNDGGYSYSSYWTGTQQPTNRVSWYEGLQFCNYLTSGDKSRGVYQFSGNNTNPGDFLGINRAAAQTAYGTIYFLPSEDEWYKAAYYTGSGYSTYANGTDVAPIAGAETNYDWAIGRPWNVGTGMQEQNGTFDMMGNVWEWDEALISSLRGIRGGYCGQYCLSSSSRIGTTQYSEGDAVGFRVASVPEPCSLVLLSLGGLALLRKVKHVK